LYLTLSERIPPDPPSASALGEETKKTGIIETTDAAEIGVLARVFGP
jgi:hypothetical protein